MLEAVNITKIYPGADMPVVDRVSLRIAEREFVSVVGRSGSGKTTLLNILSSLVLPDAGGVFFEDTDICRCPEKERDRLRRDVFAVVFQQHHLMPYLTVMENVLLPFMGGIRPVTAEQRRQASDVLEQVGLGGKEKSLPGKLSGGEQQRAAIARALARGARVLFADEPTGSLDSVTGDAIMDLLQQINHGGVTLLMVTHNPEYAARAGRSIVMADGRVAA